VKLDNRFQLISALPIVWDVVMRRVRMAFMLLVALLWAPVTWHCHLEELPTLGFLACCAHEEVAPHQDADCDTDSCAVVESGDYRTQENRAILVVPDFVPVELQLAVVELTTLPAEVSLGILTAAPPEQRHIWQFAFRTALPVRAPSLTA
jgi:hypothetical protein